MIDEWRLITDDSVAGSFGLAGDEYMSRRVGLGLSAPVLRLYTYRSHCALVGRHQNVDSELHRSFCESHDIAINRRPTGGGAIIMGADQLGIALIIPADSHFGNHHRIRELFSSFSLGIVAGLEKLGISADFAGKNDIEVRRRKLAGLGLSHNREGGLLMHASVLVDLDVALMLRVLRTPFEKIADKGIAAVSQRVTTVRRETSSAVTLDLTRSAICLGFATAFNASIRPSEFNSGELEGIDQLDRSKFQTAGWIDAKAVALDALGQARVKTPGGLLEVQIAIGGDIIKATYITGDFFADEESVTALEHALKWTAADARSVAANVEGFFADSPNAFEGMPARDVARAITIAVLDARKKENSLEPYGCFVNPGMSH